MVDVHWYARALTDRADVDVVAVDVPGLLVIIVAAAAGESGHGAVGAGERAVNKEADS